MAIQQFPGDGVSRGTGSLPSAHGTASGLDIKLASDALTRQDAGPRMTRRTECPARRYITARSNTCRSSTRTGSLDAELAAGTLSDADVSDPVPADDHLPRVRRDGVQAAAVRPDGNVPAEQGAGGDHARRRPGAAQGRRLHRSLLPRKPRPLPARPADAYVLLHWMGDERGNAIPQDLQ